MKIKARALKKISIGLAAGMALLVLSVGAVGQVSAGTPAPPPSSQCTGDVTQCVCPADKPDAGNCRDPAFANCKQDKDSQQYKDCRANNNLFKRYINPIIAFLSFAVGLAVVIGIIAGGIQYATSAGDAQKAAEGKRHIWSAIFALLIYLFLFALLNFLIPGGIV